MIPTDVHNEFLFVTRCIFSALITCQEIKFLPKWKREPFIAHSSAEILSVTLPGTVDALSVTLYQCANLTLFAWVNKSCLCSIKYSDMDMILLIFAVPQVCFSLWL